jgi:SAM-dependent methyltransferase
MFNNKLIESIASASDPASLRLSPRDWQLVLNANAQFTEGETDWKGSAEYGKYLLAKIGAAAKDLDFHNSLELCAGNGFLFFSLSPLRPFDESSHFIDLSARQCDDFRRRCEKAGIQPPTIRCADISSLPYETASLQMVYGHSFLHHLPDVPAYLAEISRVLRKNGRFVDFHEPTPTAPWMETFPLSLLKEVSQDSLTDIWLLRPDVVRRLFLEAGFGRVEIHFHNLAASFLVSPVQVVRDKLRRSRNSYGMLRARMLADKVDRFLPKGLLRRFAPSISIVAVKE